jgi:hypothetical protein
MMNPLTSPKALVALLMLAVSFSQINAADTFYPASEDECNRSCSFDHQASRQCLSNVIAENYTKEVLSKALTGVMRRVLDQAEAETCICAKAKLESTGRFSSVDIVRTTSVSAGSAVQRALLELDLPPVPAEAVCLLQPPLNPIPLSVSNFR